jgi:hypothetical protein
MSAPCASQAENVREWGALCADTITVVAEWINEQDGRCVPYRTLSRRGDCPAYSVRGRFMRRTTQRCARHLYGVVGGAQVGRAHGAAVFLPWKVSDAAPWRPNHIRKCVLVLLRAWAIALRAPVTSPDQRGRKGQLAIDQGHRGFSKADGAGFAQCNPLYFKWEPSEGRCAPGTYTGRTCAGVRIDRGARMIFADSPAKPAMATAPCPNSSRRRARCGAGERRQPTTRGGSRLSVIVCARPRSAPFRLARPLSPRLQWPGSW